MLFLLYYMIQIQDSSVRELIATSWKKFFFLHSLLKLSGTTSIPTLESHCIVLSALPGRYRLTGRNASQNGVLNSGGPERTAFQPETGPGGAFHNKSFSVPLALLMKVKLIVRKSEFLQTRLSSTCFITEEASRISELFEVSYFGRFVLYVGFLSVEISISMLENAGRNKTQVSVAGYSI